MAIGRPSWLLCINDDRPDINPYITRSSPSSPPVDTASMYHTFHIFSHPICFLSKVTKLLMKLIKQAHQDKRCLCASANQTSLRVRLIVALSRELINPFIKNIFFYDNII
ncbi:hypothetical protein F4703DRAFT_1790297 [Phycomyces blakesleeanus]